MLVARPRTSSTKLMAQCATAVSICLRWSVRLLAYKAPPEDWRAPALRTHLRRKGHTQWTESTWRVHSTRVP
jgi:hypothetical protein